MDPEFHKHALAHSRAMDVEMKRLLDEAVTARAGGLVVAREDVTRRADSPGR